MTTAAERLQELSGLAGVTAAAMLLAIGTGATAGALLVSRSTLSSATAAAHLLDAGVQTPASSGGGGWASPRYRQRTENDEALLLLGLI